MLIKVFKMFFRFFGWKKKVENKSLGKNKSLPGSFNDSLFIGF
jgi:hypothetical protein